MPAGTGLYGGLKELMSLGATVFAFVLLGSSLHARAAAAPVSGPMALRVDNLETPLGIDDPAPRFSWQLHDDAEGARQTAYEVSVATSTKLLDHPDVWTSGRITSSQSLGVSYAGPTLRPSTRYYWRVRVWGAGAGDAEKRYPEATPSWFETGLLTQDAWKAKWIGYETQEEAAVRHAPAEWIADPERKDVSTGKLLPVRFAFRTTVSLSKPVKQAVLYATGQETVSAWVNGTKVLGAAPNPPWHQLPWKKFVRTEVTGKVSAGLNTLAIEPALYSLPAPGSMAGPPIIATLFATYNDGSVETFSTSPAWKTSGDAAQGWQQKDFDDSLWKNAEDWIKADGDNVLSPGHPWISDSVKALSRTFDVTMPIKSARVYATALGEYEILLNGARVSSDVFSPGWTDYRERVIYQTYDVTGLIHEGRNDIGALLAPGWFSTPLEWQQQPNNYGDTAPALRVQLRIEHEDGTVVWVNTDPSWTAKQSEILSAQLYDGETQDARKAISAQEWRGQHGLSDGWEPVITIEPRPLQIVGQNFQPVRVERTLPAVAVSHPGAGVSIYDFGQNLAGVEHLRVSGPAGTDFRIRFGEILNADGTLYTENLRTAKATDHFILAGKGVEEFTPQFTYHGFRYAEVTGLPTVPGKDALTALVVHTDAPFTTNATTGSAMVNQLLSNILWGQRSNFVSVPTDCPQRDERLGWMADAQVFWRTASYNMDLAAFSRKFSTDMRGTQAGTSMYGIYAPGTARENMGFGPGWSDAGVIIPWTSWLQSGDTRIIDENWDAMAKYLTGIESANPDGLWENDGGIAFGDWLAPEGRTSQVLIATAYWAYDASLMADMAHATGRTAEEQQYRRLFATIKKAFQKQSVRNDGFVAGVDPGPSPFGEGTHSAEEGQGDTQTGYVLALHMNLLPDNLRAAAAQRLVNKIQANHGLLATGFLGTPYLLEELTKAGHAGVAYQLLLNTQYPSWGYLIDHGATTTWER
jgi:alpha-L-rhamnosidase